MAVRQSSNKAAVAKPAKKTDDIRLDIAVQHPEVFREVFVSAEGRIFAGMKLNPDASFDKIVAAVLRANEALDPREREAAISQARRDFDAALAESKSFGRKIDRIYSQEVSRAYAAKKNAMPAQPTATERRRKRKYRDLKRQGKTDAQILDAMVAAEDVSQQAIRQTLHRVGIVLNTGFRRGRNKRDRKTEG